MAECERAEGAAGEHNCDECEVIAVWWIHCSYEDYVGMNEAWMEYYASCMENATEWERK